MKIVILDGNTDPENSHYERYLHRLGDLMGEKGNEISVFTLRDLKINNCIGCYTCWLKTPGICVFRDDMTAVIKEYINADVALQASPVVMGFVTYLLKRANERLLPLVHPYLRLAGDRFQHPHRYARNPSLGLLLWNNNKPDNGSLKIIDEIFRSNKVRRHLFTRFMDNNVKEIADAVNDI